MDYKNKLTKLMLTCIDKGFQFDINSGCKNVSVIKFSHENKVLFNHDCYYDGRLTNIVNGSTITLDELIEKVKCYKP